MSRKARILSIVLHSPEPVTAADVAAETSIEPKSVRDHLLRLYKSGAIDRSSKRQKKRFVYSPKEGADEIVEKILEGVVLDKEWAELPGDADVDAAIAAAEKAWRERST